MENGVILECGVILDGGVILEWNLATSLVPVPISLVAVRLIAMVAFKPNNHLIFLLMLFHVSNYVAILFYMITKPALYFFVKVFLGH